MFSRHFLCLSLVNLLLLASLEERSIYGESDCFLGAKDGDDLEEDILMDEAIRDKFALFWKTMAGPEMEAFPYF